MVLTREQMGWRPQWDARVEAKQREGLLPARITRVDRTVVHLWSESGEGLGVIEPDVRKAWGESLSPAVGDWVLVEQRSSQSKWIVRELLPRFSVFRRKEPHKRAREQIIAANLDHVILVSALDRDFNLSRLERFHLLAVDSDLPVTIFLNKADVCPDAAEKRTSVERSFPKVSVLTGSATDGSGIEPLRAVLHKGMTTALLGSSGVGKSSLINALAGENVLKTGAIREKDQRGRHTTTWREMRVLPDGGIVIDTAGLRELQLLADSQALEATFADVIELMRQCRFRNCRCENEPGCAVRAAIRGGLLEERRLENYLKMKAQLDLIATRTEQRTELKGRYRARSLREYERGREEED